MKKLSLPNIHLTKKQILLYICIPLTILILLAITFFILKGMGKINIGNNPSNKQEQLADDSEAARDIPLQAYTLADTEKKYMVYADIIKTDPEVEMIETCTYSDGTEAKETKYYVGREPVQVSNHCLLTFAEYDGPNTLEETYPYNVYLVLPDGSLITLDTKETPSIQVNMYEKETRIVQLNGYAYYRVAPQKNGKKFSVQMVDRVMYVTGTEFFAGVSSSFSGDGIWGHIELYEGSAEVKLRAQDLIIMMTSKDYANYGHWKENGSWAWYWDEANAGKIHTFYSNNSTTKTETFEFAGEGDKITMGYMDKVTDFLYGQVETTMATYGFGNYKKVANSLEAYVDEEIVTEKKLRQEMVIKETLAYAKAYENYQKWYDGLVEKGQELRAKAAAEAAASVSTGTTYSVCPKGTAYAGNGKCCPAGTYLNTNGYCQGNSSTSGNTVTKYNPTTPSVTTSSGSSNSSSGSNCVTSGTVAYQACKMAAEGVTNNGQYTLSGNKCCMPDISEPTLEPVK